MRPQLVLFATLVLLTNLFAGENDAFWDAARNGDTQKLAELLESGVDVNAKTRYGATALSYAADRNHHEAVKFLLEKGADPNITDTFYRATPFLWSLSEGNLEIVTAMIEHGADLKAPNVLRWATFGENPDVIRLLLKKGATGGKSLLLGSISGGDSVIAEVVLSSEEFDAKDLSEALGLALEKNLIEVVKKLRALGAKEPVKTKPNPVFSKYEGDFQSDVTGAGIKGQSDKLILTFESGGSVTFFRADNERFLSEDSTMAITFKLGSENASGFKFERTNGSFQTEFKRKAASQKELEIDVEALAKKDLELKVEKPKNWASFRGNNATGIGDGQSPPTVWDAEKSLNLAWKTPIPGLAHASPIVWKDRVFVTTAISKDTTAEYRVGLYGDVSYVDDKTEHVWRIYCLNRLSGEVLWQKDTFQGVPKVKRHTKATQANSTPATNGKYVVALFGSEGLSCYDLDGNLKWQKDLGLLDAGWFYDKEVQWGHASSPIIYKNSVIVQCDRSANSYIAAYDLESGKEVWRTERDEIPSWGTPALFEGERAELITNSSAFIYAYDPNTGKELWRHKMNSEITVATPIVYDGMVYLTSGYAPNRPVLAIKPGGSGDISLADSLESSENVAWRHKRGGTYMPTPIAYQGYFYTCNNNGIWTCYDAKTGEQKYRGRVAGRARVAFTASPVAADGKIYVPSEEGIIYVLKAGPKYELIAKNPVGEILLATPAISNGMFFVRGQKHLFAFGATVASK